MKMNLQILKMMKNKQKTKTKPPPRTNKQTKPNASPGLPPPTHPPRSQPAAPLQYPPRRPSLTLQAAASLVPLSGASAVCWGFCMSPQLISLSPWCYQNKRVPLRTLGLSVASLSSLAGMNVWRSLHLCLPCLPATMTSVPQTEIVAGLRPSVVSLPRRARPASPCH